MADFEARLASAAETAPWDDLVSPLLPSRLNAPRYPHRYYRIRTLPYVLEVEALVAGVVEPDVNLGGRLFAWGWSHYGNGPVPGFTSAPGQSSEASAIFTSENTGLWLVRAWRPESGAFIFGVSVEP